MNFFEFLDGFEFDYDLVLNEEVNSVSVFNDKFFELNREQDLSFDCKASKCELMKKAGFVGLLKKAWPEFTMNLNSRSNNLLTQ